MEREAEMSGGILVAGWQRQEEKRRIGGKSEREREPKEDEKTSEQ